jgi:hypothetical protein
MGTNPFNKAIPTTLSRGDGQDDPFAVVRVRVQLLSVQNKEYLHGRMSDPFIAADEPRELRRTSGTALRKATVQFAILGEDVCSRSFEIRFAMREKIPHGRKRQFLLRNVQSPGSLGELLLLDARHFHRELHLGPPDTPIPCGWGVSTQKIIITRITPE